MASWILMIMRKEFIDDFCIALFWASDLIWNLWWRCLKKSLTMWKEGTYLRKGLCSKEVYLREGFHSEGTCLREDFHRRRQAVSRKPSLKFIEFDGTSVTTSWINDFRTAYRLYIFSYWIVHRLSCTTIVRTTIHTSNYVKVLPLFYCI